MLILTRRRGESIFISDEDNTFSIEVAIKDVCGKTVKVGIQAPEHIKIRRDTPHQEIENISID